MRLRLHRNDDSNWRDQSLCGIAIPFSNFRSTLLKVCPVVLKRALPATKKSPSQFKPSFVIRIPPDCMQQAPESKPVVSLLVCRKCEGSPAASDGCADNRLVLSIDCLRKI